MYRWVEDIDYYRSERYLEMPDEVPFPTGHREYCTNP